MSTKQTFFGMTEAEYRTKCVTQLKKIHKSYDIEDRHVHADEVLCNLLRAYGAVDVVDTYKKIGKWYA